MRTPSGKLKGSVSVLYDETTAEKLEANRRHVGHVSTQIVSWEFLQGFGHILDGPPSIAPSYRLLCVAGVSALGRRGFIRLVWVP
jgi:hypothetical protein